MYRKTQIKKVAPVIFCIVIFITGCRSTYLSNNIDLKETLNTAIMENRESTEYPQITKVLDKENYHTLDLDFKRLNKQKDVNENISIDGAIEDVMIFMEVLKRSYPGYYFFGEKGRFEEAKLGIIEELLVLQNNGINKINSSLLQEMMYSHLTFIKDGHFWIGSKKLIEHNTEVYYSSEEINFLLDDKGKFYTIIDDKRYYLETINGESTKMNNYLKLSLREDGELVYYIGRLLNPLNSHKDMIITLRNGNDLIEEKIILNNNRKYIGDEKKFNFDEIEGIPYITVRSFVPHEGMEDFILSATKIKDAPHIIIDLRSNEGGSTEFSTEWYKNYTGKWPETNVRWYMLVSELNKFLYKETLTNFYGNFRTDEEIEEMIKKMGFDEENEGLQFKLLAETKREKVVLDKEQTIFVLMDNYVASAGENFIYQLKNLNNVVLIGTNTSGTKLIGPVVNWYLPNSNLEIRSGIGLYLEPNGFEEEGVGHMPDIWLDTPDVEVRLINFIKKYY